MKKIFFSIVAIAALAACTKSEVAYEPTDEIGFSVVAGNITKSVVDGNVYPTSLNMYVNAWTTDNADTTPNYIEEGEFAHDDEYNLAKEVWGGVTPYYWPNVKKLYFAGFSKADGLALGNVSYNTNTDVLTFADYTPAKSGNNDLMWFPKTAQSYGKGTDYVSVDMYHTCAWITFLVKGDDVTSGKYTVTALQMYGVDQTATLTCTGTTVGISGNTDKYENPTAEKPEDLISLPAAKYDVTKASKVGDTEVDYTGVLTETATNFETGVENGITGGDIVVLPQVPGMLSLTYTYTSPSDDPIEETVTGVDLKLAKNTGADPDDTSDDQTGPAKWEAGKHYIYTITIKANEILIAPTPVDWTEENWNVTVE